MIERTYDVNGVDVVLSADDSKVEELNRIAGIVNSTRIIKGTSDRDIDLLDPKFKTDIKLVLARSEADGYVFRPFFTLRSVWKQARLWRQSRPTAEIQRAIQKLKQERAPFLAHVLKSVGPQMGRWATNALPGQSWHQWGFAIDCFLATPQGRAIWSSSHEGYKVYADHAVALGLTAGYYWKRQDSVHIQSTDKTVRSVYTWAEIDSAMALQFQEPD